MPCQYAADWPQRRQVEYMIVYKSATGNTVRVVSTCIPNLEHSGLGLGDLPRLSQQRSEYSAWCYE